MVIILVNIMYIIVELLDVYRRASKQKEKGDGLLLFSFNSLNPSASVTAVLFFFCFVYFKKQVMPLYAF